MPATLISLNPSNNGKSVDVQSLYDGLVKAQSNLSFVEQDIRRLESIVSSSQAELARLRPLQLEYSQEVESRTPYVKSRCFINRLADETLCAIFLPLVQDFDPAYPWLLQGVCARWRKACLHDPKLWAYIDITPRHRCSEKAQHSADGLMRTMLQLDRSRSVLLSIMAVSFCDCAVQEYRFQALVEHSSRWVALCFNGFHNGTPGKIPFRHLIPQDASFANLRTMQWTVAHAGQGGGIIKVPFTSYATFTSLSTLSIYNITDMESYQQLSWATLQTLILSMQEESSPRDLLAVLSLCQSLTYLRLHVYQAARPLDGNPLNSMGRTDEMIAATLPLVVECTIWEHIPNSTLMTDIVPHIQLPALQSLRLSTSLSVQPIIDLVQRSSCGGSITVLHLHTFNSEEQSAMTLSLLRLCPNLLHVSVIANRESIPPRSFYPNQPLRSLIIREGSDVLCPSLRSISYSCYGLDPVIIMQIVESRATAGRGLQWVTIQVMAKKTMITSVSMGPPLLGVAPATENSQSELEYDICKRLIEERSKAWKPRCNVSIQRVFV